MSFTTLKYALFAVLLLTIAGVIFYIVNLFSAPKPQFRYNLSSQTVIKELKALNRLETTSFTIEKVIDAGTSGNAFQEFIYGDRILLIAHGQVIAGVDLSKLSEKDITVSGDAITLRLPSSEVLVVTLDNGQTRVYDRKQGLLSRGNKDLESNARKVATETIRDAACKGEILREASDNARKQLTALLKAFGFVTVTITIPDASC